MTYEQTLQWLKDNKGWIDHYEIPDAVIDSCIKALTEQEKKDDLLDLYKTVFKNYVIEIDNVRQHLVRQHIVSQHLVSQHLVSPT